MDFDLEERDVLWFGRVRGSREETSGKGASGGGGGGLTGTAGGQEGHLRTGIMVSRRC